jgi:arylsulfatase A-like enzyme
VYSGDLYANEAVNVIEAYAGASRAATDRGDEHAQPLLLYLALQLVHEPLQAPHAAVSNRSTVPNPSRQMYTAMLLEMDAAIYAVVEALKRTGLWEDTWLFWSSDNGSMPPTTTSGGSNWPLRGGKRTLWEGGMHVPALVSGGRLPAVQRGQVSHTLFHVSDVLPTMLALAAGPNDGLSAGQNTSGRRNLLPFDGVDQSAVLLGTGNSTRTSLVHNIDPLPSPGQWQENYGQGPHAAARSGRWKLVVGDPGVHSAWYSVPIDAAGTNQSHTLPSPRPAARGNCSTSADPHDFGRLSLEPATVNPCAILLLDLMDDPLETTNVAALHPDIVEDLLAVLRTANATSFGPCYQPAEVEADPGRFNGTWAPWHDHGIGCDAGG